MVTKVLPEGSSPEKGRLGRLTPHMRRDHIVAVAKDVFLEEGYAASSMSTIADRLGGSKATLYKYFRSKEALFEAMMQQHCAVAFAVLTELQPPTDDVRALLHEFGTRYLAKLSQPDTLKIARLVHGEGARVPEVARIFFRHGPDRAHGFLAVRLADMAAAGHIICSDPLLTAKQFLGMVRGDRHMRVVCGLAERPSAAEVDHYVDHAIALVAPALEAVPGG